MKDTINAITLFVAAMTGFLAVTLLLLLVWIGWRRRTTPSDRKSSLQWKGVVGRILTAAGKELQNSTKHDSPRRLPSDPVDRRNIDSTDPRSDT